MEKEMKHKKHKKLKKKRSFDMPGQRKDTPESDDPKYIFYTSLLKQNKKSKMALVWCLEHGLFARDKAERISMQLKMEKLSLKDNKKLENEKD
jgi:hypothetical protein